MGGEHLFLGPDFTFCCVTFDWDVPWLWFFCLRVALCLKIILHTYLMVFRCLENFLWTFEIEKYPSKQLVAHFGRKIRNKFIKGFKSSVFRVNNITWWASKKFSTASFITTNVLAMLLDIIETQKDKWNYRTRSQLISRVPNVGWRQSLKKVAITWTHKNTFFLVFFSEKNSYF